MANILIAGCGYVGTALGKNLASEGHTVHGLRRNPDRLPEALHPVQADLTDPSALSDLPDDIEYLFYTASASGRGPDAYQSIYVDGLKNLLDALDQDPIQRILYTSSTAVYGQKDGQWVDETSPTEPDRRRGQILLEAEEIVRSQDAHGIVVRYGGIYGPGRQRYINLVKSGRASCYDGPKRYTNKNHLADCAGILQHLMTLEDPYEAYNGTDPNPTDRCEILTWLAHQLDVPEPDVKPIEEASFRIKATNKRISSERLRNSGYEFVYPSYKEGYAPLLEEEE
jgi:nucleoside-diphosphate-sugar epimerase